MSNFSGGIDSSDAGLFDARKFFFGSYALWAGKLAAEMFSLCATLEIWKINPRSWLTAYFEACAQHGGKPPPDAARWLPWNLSAEQRRAMAELPAVNDSSFKERT